MVSPRGPSLGQENQRNIFILKCFYFKTFFKSWLKFSLWQCIFFSCQNLVWAAKPWTMWLFVWKRRWWIHGKYKNINTLRTKYFIILIKKNYSLFISGYDMGKNSILAEVTLNQQKLVNCLIVFDHFVVLGLKG